MAINCEMEYSNTIFLTCQICCYIVIQHFFILICIVESCHYSTSFLGVDATEVYFNIFSPEVSTKEHMYIESIARVCSGNLYLVVINRISLSLQLFLEYLRVLRCEVNYSNVSK